MSAYDDKIIVENINVPGYTTKVNAVKYKDMKQAMLKVLPTQEPGFTQSEIQDAVKAHLSRELFPGGAKAGWWAKTVQLDLEAKGKVVREDTKPLRWHKLK